MRIINALAAAALATPALAHDFWIQPSNFSPASGQVVGVQLRVGDTFPGDVLPRDEARIVRFVALGPSTSDPVTITGRQGRDPAGLVRFSAPGAHILAYQSTPSTVTLAADKFETYLKDKGLEHISRLRADQGKSPTEAHEIYSRSVKSILAVDGKGGKGFDAEAGLRLEIVPLTDPTALYSGSSLKVKVLYEHRPLSNALMFARSPSYSGDPITARTDAQGQAELSIPAAGMWLIDTVEMSAAPAGSGAEWESVWGSLTFSTPDVPREPKP